MYQKWCEEPLDSWDLLLQSMSQEASDGLVLTRARARRYDAPKHMEGGVKSGAITRLSRAPCIIVFMGFWSDSVDDLK